MTRAEKKDIAYLLIIAILYIAPAMLRLGMLFTATIISYKTNPIKLLSTIYWHAPLIYDAL